MKKAFNIVLIITILYSANTAYSKDEGYSTLGEVAEWSIITSAFASGYIIDHTPVWTSKPLIGGTTNSPYHKNTIHSSWLYAGVGLLSTGIALLPNNSGWINRTSYINTKGIIEAVSFTYFVTALTKNIVGRKRPSCDNFPADDEIDSKKSFFSGHSAISFSIATYSSLYVFEHIGNINDPLNLASKILFTTGMASLASYVAYSRVEDNMHFVSDVVVGGMVGITMSSLVYAFQNKWLYKKRHLVQRVDVSFYNGVESLSISAVF